MFNRFSRLSHHVPRVWRQPAERLVLAWLNPEAYARPPGSCQGRLASGEGTSVVVLPQATGSDVGMAGGEVVQARVEDQRRAAGGVETLHLADHDQVVAGVVHRDRAALERGHRVA
jgi:hypothetical protein